MVIDVLPLTLIALQLTSCREVSALPDSIGKLSALQLLNLKGCSELQVKMSCEY